MTLVIKYDLERVKTDRQTNKHIRLTGCSVWTTKWLVEKWSVR